MSLCHRFTRLPHHICRYSQILSITHGSKSLHEPKRLQSKCLEIGSKKHFKFFTNNMMEPLKSTHLNLFRLFSSSSIMDEGVYQTLVEETLDILSEKLELYLDQFDDPENDVLLSVSLIFKIA